MLTKKLLSLKEFLNRGKAISDGLKSSNLCQSGKVSICMTCLIATLYSVKYMRQHGLLTGHVLAEAAELQTISFEEDLPISRVAELPASIKLLVLFDTLNPLHLEWLLNQDLDNKSSEMWINIRDNENESLVDELEDLCDVEFDKVSAKNRPTFIYKASNRL